MHLQLITDNAYTWELRVGNGPERLFRGFLTHFTETSRGADLGGILSIDFSSRSRSRILSSTSVPQCAINDVACDSRGSKRG